MMFIEERNPARAARFTAQIFVILALLLTLPAVPAAHAKGGEGKSSDKGSIEDDDIAVGLSDEFGVPSLNEPSRSDDQGSPPPPPRYSYIWEPVSEYAGCGSTSGGGSWSCAPHPDSCEADNGRQFIGEGDALEIGAATTITPTKGVTQRGTRITLDTGETTDLGIRCALPGTPEFAEAPPVVITVTREDFARMPVTPLQAHAGPPDGWLPVNMVNVLYVDPAPQDLAVELLDTPVAIRATPVSYHWDLGDGNTLTTTDPGTPYPSETISATYTQEGWYDITLTTTFSGQFSVNGGTWQDIDGTIEITSDPVPLFSKSLESRLVDGDTPVDEEGDPWIPERTPDTEGPQDPDAGHRTI